MKATIGFSLIELVIVIMLVAILGSATGVMLQQVASASLTQAAKTDQSWQLRLTTERMARDLTQIQSATGLVNNANQLTFVTMSGAEVTYELDSVTPTLLMRKEKANAGASLVSRGLADNISDINFHYYDANGLEITAGSNPQNVRYIKVRLTSTSNNTDTSVETLLAPRRLNN